MKISFERDGCLHCQAPCSTLFCDECKRGHRRILRRASRRPRPYSRAVTIRRDGSMDVRELKR